MLLPSILLIFQALDTSRPPPPHSGCLDARAVTEVNAISARHWLLRAGHQRARLEFADDCPKVVAPAELLAKDGWVCGGPREFARVDGQYCPVARVDALTPGKYAQLLRDADLARGSADVAVMDQVETRALRHAYRGFLGSPEYCLRISDVRSWSSDDGDIVVKVKRRPPGRYETYRIEFHGGCTEARSLPLMTLRSGVGTNLLCGNPGDVAVITRDTSACGFGFHCPEARSGGDAISASYRGCMVSAVYPIDP